MGTAVGISATALAIALAVATTSAQAQNGQRGNDLFRVTWEPRQAGVARTLKPPSEFSERAEALERTTTARSAPPNRCSRA
jgi:hypothetical protein